MDEWHIGDPVDWGDGFMDAQNGAMDKMMTMKEASIVLKIVPSILKGMSIQKKYGIIIWIITLVMHFIILI